jgi:uncharacterized repeat protein (TIGR03803 family)
MARKSTFSTNKKLFAASASLAILISCQHPSLAAAVIGPPPPVDPPTDPVTPPPVDPPTDPVTPPPVDPPNVPLPPSAITEEGDGIYVTTVYNFGSSGSAIYPLNGLVKDENNRLFGTSGSYKSSIGGEVYVYNPESNTVSTLHVFDSSFIAPTGEPLTYDGAGTFYGAFGQSEGVFKLGKDGNFSVIASACSTNRNCVGPTYSFGVQPVLGKDGFLYDSYSLGTYGDYTSRSYQGIMRLSVSGEKSELFHYPLTEYVFTNPSAQGKSDTIGNGYILSPFLVGKKNQLYGFSWLPYNLNYPDRKLKLAIFRFNSNGISYLHKFQSNWESPVGSLIQDKDGNLYGITVSREDKQAANGNATLFKVSPDKGFTIIHTFSKGEDGGFDYGIKQGELTLASDGNIYGTTPVGGTNKCGQVGCGTIFRVDPEGNFKTIFQFTKTAQAFNSLVETEDGVLYGTALNGGTNDKGAIFRVDLVPGTQSFTFSSSQMDSGDVTKSSVVSLSPTETSTESAGDGEIQQDEPAIDTLEPEVINSIEAAPNNSTVPPNAEVPKKRTTAYYADLSCQGFGAALTKVEIRDQMVALNLPDLNKSGYEQRYFENFVADSLGSVSNTTYYTSPSRATYSGATEVRVKPDFVGTVRVKYTRVSSTGKTVVFAINLFGESAFIDAKFKGKKSPIQLKDDGYQLAAFIDHLSDPNLSDASAASRLIPTGGELQGPITPVVGSYRPVPVFVLATPLVNINKDLRDHATRNRVALYQQFTCGIKNDSYVANNPTPGVLPILRLRLGYPVLRNPSVYDGYAHPEGILSATGLDDFRGSTPGRPAQPRP